MRAPQWLGPIGLRLAAAFVAVALAAVAVLTIALLVVDRSDVNRLAGTDRHQTTDAISAALSDAYRVNGGWSGADLQPAVTLAETAGIGLALDSPSGDSIVRAGPQRLFSRDSSAVVRKPVTVESVTVGRLRLAFRAEGLSLAERHLRRTLATALGWSAAAAALVALAVALVIARAFVGPVRRLSGAVRALERGSSSTRVGGDAGPGELGELGRAFDSMADSLEREDRLRRALVADVAHELRTPLAVLQADTEALLDGFSTPTAEVISSLHDETVRLGRMVEDLQTLAAAEAAGLSLDRHPLDFARVASEAADSLALRFRTAELRLTADLPPTIVLGDPNRLRQIVTNLLANALKFTPAGGQVTLAVRSEGGQAVLDVTDTGPGIPPGEQQRIWDRFYQGEAGRAAAGSGIGLAVVKELAVAHGGTVSLTIPPGGGTRFTVRIPLATQAAADD